ncbi:hypothetical protein Fcan01_08899 [Folsomia candida]|uniref:Uncharacterized protein n=1 Tax=Folsomia candida TaxID=158441 RepID=A0A226EGF3_FOLCA|nr:hypothetical protein Fcan01_08899 [Folsomia candida]
MGRRRLFQLSARHKRRLVKNPSEIFEENLNSDLVQAEGENIYSEQVFEEDLEEIEVGSNTSESKIEKLKSAGGSEVATVVESILKKLMTDDLQAKYSLYGEKGKNSLVKVKGLRQLIKDAVAAHPRTPNYPDEGTVDEEIQKSLKKVADRVGKRMRNYGAGGGAGGGGVLVRLLPPTWKTRGTMYPYYQSGIHMRQDPIPGNPPHPV